MQTKHYIVENIAEFSEQTEAVKKLEEYLDCIEEVAFPAIEKVFGQPWNNGRINIKLNDSTGGGGYSYCNNSHIVDIGINNRNIRNPYPENLWGCLFHETHHAFLNQIIRNKSNDKIFNGGHKAEVFNYAFLATTYLKLKEEGRIDERLYKRFLEKLERELDKSNRKYRALGEYEHKRECECEMALPNNTMDIFREYVSLFSMNIKNFANFISYAKRFDSVFIDVSNFRQDLDEAKEALKN